MHCRTTSPIAQLAHAALPSTHTRSCVVYKLSAYQNQRLGVYVLLRGLAYEIVCSSSDRQMLHAV